MNNITQLYIRVCNQYEKLYVLRYSTKCTVLYSARNQHEKAFEFIKQSHTA